MMKSNTATVKEYEGVKNMKVKNMKAEEYEGVRSTHVTLSQV